MDRRRKLPRTVWVLGLVSLLMDLSSEIYHALLPVFLTITLGLPVTALGTIDGIAEGTASFAKLASGRLSDRSRSRKPWILLGYGLAALSKPFIAMANGAALVLGARFVDRIGKGIRGAPRDAMVGDETPPELRGAAYGLRQALDTVGAFLAPVVAILLMTLFAEDVRTVFWIAVIPALLSFLVAALVLREPRRRDGSKAGPSPALGRFRDITRPCRRIIAVAFLFSLARFSESFLILRGVEAGLSAAMSPLMVVAFNLAYVLLAYPAGAWSDRIAGRHLLVAGIAALIAGNLLLASSTSLAIVTLGVLLWGAHMALTQGLFARLVADCSPPHLRATSFGVYYFVTGIAALLSSLGAGLLWDRSGAPAAFTASAIVAGIAAFLLIYLPRPAADE